MKIINKVEIKREATMWAFVTVVGAYIAGIASVISNILQTDKFKFLGLLGIIIVAVGLCMKYANRSTATRHFRYEVILEDSDSIMEVQKRYKIINQYGNRWILEGCEIVPEVNSSMPNKHGIEGNTMEGENRGPNEN